MSQRTFSTGSLFLEEELGEMSVLVSIGRPYDPMFYRYVDASICMEATLQFLYYYKKFNEQEYVAVMEEKMKTLLRYYRRHKNFINRLLVDRVIKMELCNLCYSNQIEDSDIVAECLRFVHEVFVIPHVNVLFYILWNFPGNSPSISATIREDKAKRRKKIYSFVAYFLHHARMKRLLFHGHRITDMFWEPLDYGVLRSGIMSNALLSYNPDVVYLLHQYGAKFTGQVINSSGPLPPLFFGELGRIIFGFQSNDQWSLDTLELTTSPSCINTVTKTMLANFMTFVLSTRNPCVTTYALAGVLFRRWRIPESHILVPFYDTFFPGLDFGRNKPCSLQHSCRHVIRKALNQNWQLPNGIWKLHLPELIRSYLNFSEYKFPLPKRRV